MSADNSKLIQSVYEDVKADESGNVADYIPELALADPSPFSLAICDVHGNQHSTGTPNAFFTIQSMCKPILYAAALKEFGSDEVHRHVGVEPTGAPFNAFIRLESQSHRPHNPMVNAGAIAISSLLSERFDVSWLLDLFRQFSGRKDLEVNLPVCLSEKATADRNRAIAFLIRYFGGLNSSVDSALDFYFQACSLMVTTTDVAMIAATLANNGQHPVSRERLLPEKAVRQVLTVMTTCGMYDGSGRFVFESGLPAKSGVGGGIMASVIGDMGIAAFSPRLDQHGNTVRGVKALKSISQALKLHMFEIVKEVNPIKQTTNLGSSLNDLLRAHKNDSGGSVAQYSDELQKTDPNHVALAICDVKGNETAAGDCDTSFSMQAISNPFTYALALHELGEEEIQKHVGVEPSGNPFDAVLFEPKTQRPYNPLGNAGAIAIASLLPGKDGSKRLTNLLHWLSRFAGNSSLSVDSKVLQAEIKSGDRNRAIAHLLKNVGGIDDVQSAIDLYFQQCSVSLTTKDLARMAATLAFGGKNPVTGEQILSREHARSVMSVMYMCGMHNKSGHFAFHVGLPAKSGASGAILAVVPGRFGVGVFSPNIDSSGTSVRGKLILQSLAQNMSESLFEALCPTKL